MHENDIAKIIHSVLESQETVSDAWEWSSHEKILSTVDTITLMHHWLFSHFLVTGSLFSITDCIFIRAITTCTKHCSETDLPTWPGKMSPHKCSSYTTCHIVGYKTVAKHCYLWILQNVHQWRSSSSDLSIAQYYEHTPSPRNSYLLLTKRLKMCCSVVRAACISTNSSFQLEYFVKK